MKTMNAFILAAGLGERLSPLTSHIPKPLLPVLGRPALDVILEEISGLPVRNIGINMHHRWEMIRDRAASSLFPPKIILFHEEDVLGTGGALKNASSFLKESMFLVHNSDILTDISLQRLVTAHVSSGNMATLAVHNLPQYNNVWIDENGSVRAVGPVTPDGSEGLTPVAFTGIAVYSPEFLDFLPQGPSSVVSAWLAASAAGEKVRTADFTGSFWSDIGTPLSYFKTIFSLLRKEGEMVYVHPSIECGKIEVGGRVVIEEGCHIGGRAFLRDCILLPGSYIPPDSRIENLIVGPGCELRIEDAGSPRASSRQDKSANFHEGISADLIGTGGSDRMYYRLARDNEAFILMECPGTDPDYERHLAYLSFFQKYSFPVARLISRDIGSFARSSFIRPGFRYALFEDLGDLSLYSWLRFRNERDRIELLYRKILDKVLSLHTLATAHAAECPLLESRVFDHEHLRWETDYFLERFVQGFLGSAVDDRDALSDEFDELAKKVANFKKTFIHRDLQSQNIMISGDETPYFIDYQGARMGPPGYDIASLLWDPYYSLGEGLREILLQYYEEGLRAYQGLGFDQTDFRDTLIPCRLQRHMQALGAYAFLSQVRGKHYFLKHIPAALGYLREETESAREDYPVLRRLVMQIHEKT